MSLGPTDAAAQSQPPAYDEASWAEAIAAFLDRLETTKKPSTHRYYESRLRTFAAWLEKEKIALTEFRGRHLSKYLKERSQTVLKARKGQPKVSDMTLRHDANAVRMLLKEARREGMIDANWLADYELPRPARRHRQYPSALDLYYLLDSIERRWNPSLNPPIKNIPFRRRQFCMTRNYAIIAGLAESGARISEMLGLLMEDFDRERLMITFRDTKTGGDRSVPVSKLWITLVDAYLPFRPKKSEANTLFVNEFGTPISPASFSHLFASHVDWARTQEPYREMLRFTAHHVRHYNATAHANKSVPAAAIIAGHKNLKTTQGYVHPEMEFVRRIHEEVAPLARVFAANPNKPVIVNTRSEKQKRKRLI